MINAYQELINYNGNDIEEFLSKIEVIHVFEDLVKIFKDKKIDLRQSIKYIVWCYSKNSDCVQIGADWLAIKKRIFEKTFLPETYYEDLVLLKNNIVLQTIQKWIDFQEEATCANLASLRDLMIEMRLSSNSQIKKSSGEIDYSQKYLNATYVQELQKIITNLEQELIQNDVTLKEGVRELKRAKKDNFSMGIEKYAV